MAIPEINNFGDEDHEKGETGLTIQGAGFGAFAGTVKMFENADMTGAEDTLTVSGTWHDLAISGVEIPASPNNSTGTVYLFVQREDLAWSQAFSFTLSAAGGAAGFSVVLMHQPMMNTARRMMR